MASGEEAPINKEDCGRVYTKQCSSFVYGTRRHSVNATSLLIVKYSIRNAWAELCAFPNISGMSFCVLR